MPADKKKKVIVVIDDSTAIIQIILSSFRSDYTVIPFTSGREAIDFFNKGQVCDLILLDKEMPGFDGFETIRALKTIDGVKNIPVVFLTGNMETESQMEGLTLGAVDYIYKPFNPVLVKKRVEIHIALEEYSSTLEKRVREKTKTIEKLSDVTIATIVSIIGTRDEETRGHISRTSEYVIALANELVKNGFYIQELDGEKLYMLRKSAPLHDVGKVGITDSILKKPGRLTKEEFEEMKLHTVIGGEAFAEARMLMNEPSFLDVAETLAMSHHEKWDGSGYPCGLKGIEIPLFGRIMAIADVYDALISRRPYKEPFTHAQAVNIIAEGKGSHFDPDICDAFLRIDNTFDKIAKKFSDARLFE